MAKRIILHPGQEFGRWTVLEHLKDKSGKYTDRALCECSCKDKTVKPVLVVNLRKGISTSCGCYRNESTIQRMTKHGLQKSKGRKHPLAGLWGGMKSRCYNPNQPHYKHYGGRGVIVCKRWRESLEAFIEDMGDRPKGASLDRIDNLNGSYTCGKCDDCISNGYSANCRWSTRHVQHRNTRVNHYIEFNGENLCLRDWSKKINVAEATLLYRLESGWGIEKTLTTPAQKNRGAENILVEYKGQKKSLIEWGKELGFKYKTLYTRIYRYKWSVEKAFTTPVGNK